MADSASDRMQGLRHTNLGRLLMNASRGYNDWAIEFLRSSGHEQLTPAHAMILPYVDMGGTRLTEIARRAGVTKQSASEMVRDLERIGYLKREQDVVDKRVTRVSFSDLGRRFVDDACAVHLRLESELSSLLQDETEDFKQCLRKWVAHVDEARKSNVHLDVK